MMLQIGMWLVLERKELSTQIAVTCHVEQMFLPQILAQLCFVYL